MNAQDRLKAVIERRQMLSELLEDDFRARRLFRICGPTAIMQFKGRLVRELPGVEEDRNGVCIVGHRPKLHRPRGRASAALHGQATTGMAGKGECSRQIDESPLVRPGRYLAVEDMRPDLGDSRQTAAPARR